MCLKCFGFCNRTTKRERQVTAMNKLRTIIITAVCSAAIVIGSETIYFGKSIGSLIKIGNVMKIMEDNFYFDYDEEKAVDYAITGLTIASEDKYTNYFDKNKYQSYLSEAQNTYIGIGIIMGAASEEDVLKIYSVTENSPADEAGILSGDLILKINDEPTSADGVQEAAEKIKKCKGAVNMLIMRDGKEFSVSVEKKSIEKHTVTSRKINDVGYIKISSFDRKDKEDENSVDTCDEFIKEAEALKNDGYEKLIIDLRDNPGGDVQVVTDIADYLLPDTVITYFEDKKGKRKYFYSDDDYTEFDIVLLVNGGSASASELLCGALTDNGAAISVGTTTFGKGIVQNVYSFADGSGLSVTTARYYTPNGKCIHETGIEPNYITEQTYDDAQLDKAVELLKK